MSITRIESGEREFVLVGTAHVSKSSVEEVEAAIREENPDVVCIELDESRYRTLSDEQAWSKVDISKILRERKGLFMLGTLVLGSFQRRIGLDIGVKQGGEMLAAVEVSEELGIRHEFCDRDIQITLRRAWSRTRLWGKMKMLAAMLSSIFTREKLGEDEIERLKESNALDEMMTELAEYLPQAKEVLIDERDRYLATRIFESEGAKTVAVVGAGHIAGIEAHIKSLQAGATDAALDSLEEVPPRSIAAKIVPWVIPAAIVGLFVAGFFRSGVDLSLQMLWRWILVNGTLSALGSLLALAHPVTILAAFVAAPITSMNPTIGVGIVTGILEAALRTPRVCDFESFHADTTSLRGFFRNRITHILVVFLLSSIGSSIGTFVAIPYLTRLLW